MLPAVKPAYEAYMWNEDLIKFLSELVDCKDDHNMLSILKTTYFIK